jgi:pilus assembly protein CpaF
MSSNALLRDRLRENQDFDKQFQDRTFGQVKDDHVSSGGVDKEKNMIKKVKERVNELFGTRILTDSKKDDFKITLRDAILRLLEEDAEYANDLTKRRTIAQKIMDDILGFGPIQSLIEDEKITEIMISRYDKVYIEQNGRLILHPDIRFIDDDQLRMVIDKIVQPIGRRIDESTPLVDARLPDGSRVNATIKPISPDGATLTIRKFSKHKLTGEDYLRFGSLDQRMLEFLKAAVIARCNIIVSGGTGSGKTTLLNMLSNYIPAWESIVTVEDSCELMLVQDNVRRLEARPKNSEGTGEISIRDLVKNCLRMRPDRIVVGEIRGGEVVDMFRAMSSGHDGSLTTIHANSPKDLVEATLPILFGMSDMSISEAGQKMQICSSVDLIVQISRLRDGSRKLINITHVVGYGKDGASKLKIKQVDPDKIYLQDIFKYKQTGTGPDGKVIGTYLATGYAPKDIMDRLAAMNVRLPAEVFAQVQAQDASEGEDVA